MNIINRWRSAWQELRSGWQELKPYEKGALVVGTTVAVGGIIATGVGLVGAAGGVIAGKIAALALSEYAAVLTPGMTASVSGSIVARASTLRLG